ncbi:MAG: carbamoyltransferase [Arenibacterium sp.]
MSYTIGLATMDNSAAALFHNGTLLAAVEEERLSRIKNDGAFPHLAIQECLRIADIAPEAISHVAIYWQPWRMGTRALGVLKKATSSARARKAVWSRARQMMLRDRNNTVADVSGSWSDLFRIRKVLKPHFGDHKPEISFHDHHLCHQLYAERMRDWDDIVSLSYDGGGEVASTVLSVVRGGKREQISLHHWPNSLGHFYSFFTGYLGFKMLEGEYKMMGLAPYGKPVYAEALQDHILQLLPGGRYHLNTKLADYHAALKGEFASELHPLFGPPRAPGEEPSEAHVNLAASVQHVHEQALMHLLEPARAKHPELKRLVISGGCALNVTANGRLLSDGVFEEIMIPPAPHDAGCAIGAGLARLSDAGVAADPVPLRSPYLGAEFGTDAIITAAKQVCATLPTPLDDASLVDETAKLLDKGLVVAWFQGRVEFGPRALGARSFLADPRRDGIREELNQKIKKRELFRPFAPSVTMEAAADFFEIDQPSPYMNIVAKVRDARRNDIPAVTHTDQTARVHSVSALANPLYHALLTRFGELTGVPVLLNTSFNIQEPIVYSPKDALATFKASGVDALVIGPYVLRREHLV